MNEQFFPPAQVYNIEDKADVSEILKQQFQGNIIHFSRLNYHHDNIEKALAQADKQPISLFLVDINLKPGESRLTGTAGSGMKIIRHIKDKAKTSFVVAYSSDDGYEEECKKNGADEFVHKSGADYAAWEEKLNNIKIKFLTRYNDATFNGIKGSLKDDDAQTPDTNRQGTQIASGAAPPRPIFTQKILAWIRDMDEVEERVEIECEIKGKIERRYINSHLLGNFREVYSGQPIMIVITNDNGRVLIEFEAREAPDGMDENPFDDPQLRNSPIFERPDINPTEKD